VKSLLLLLRSTIITHFDIMRVFWVILVKYGKYNKNFREIVFVFDDCGKKDEPPLLSDGKLRGLDLLMFF